MELHEGLKALAGQPHLALQDDEKSNDLRKKLEARKALSAATTQVHQGAFGRKAGGAGAGSRENGYAKLEGPKVSTVLQTVCLTLGRDSMASKRKAPEPDEQQTPEEAQRQKRRDKTFLAVGQDPSISRRHVELVFDFHKRRWALICLGRHGVYVDNVLISQVPISQNTLLRTSCLDRLFHTSCFGARGALVYQPVCCVACGTLTQDGRADCAGGRCCDAQQQV
jgi:hypothetical protein